MQITNLSNLIQEIMETKSKVSGAYVTDSDIDRLMLKYQR